MGSAVDVVVRWGEDVVSVQRAFVQRNGRIAVGAESIAAPAGANTETHISGALTIEVSRAAPAAFRERERDWNAHGGFIASLLLHLAGASLAAWSVAIAPFGLGDDERVAILRDREEGLTTKAVEALLVEEAAGDRDDVSRGAGVDPSASGGAPSPKGGVASRSPAGASGARGPDADDPASFGIVSLLANMRTEVDADARWMPAGAGGTTRFGFSGGTGLELSGTGEGSGGSGLGVPGGLGPGGVGFGSCGGDCLGSGYRSGAMGHGRLGAIGHRTTSPSVRCGSVVDPDHPNRGGCTTTVNGRLPPEVIQRVVRQNFGRFRGCYETALARNPSLSGHVGVKFVIDGDGSVMTALDDGSDLANPAVVQCIVRAFAALSFPRPEGGVVTVRYPLLLAPE